MNLLQKNRTLFGLILMVVIILFCLALWNPVWFNPYGQLTTVLVPTEGVSTTTQGSAVVKSDLFHYIEIIDGCGPYYDTGVCVNMRKGPGVEYPVVGRLRNGLVLKVASLQTKDASGRSWYKIIFSTKLLYPERVDGDWYVAVDPSSILALTDVGDENMTNDTPATTKRIVVDLSQEMLYAYDGNMLFMQEPVSTGLEFTPTQLGTFNVFRKTPSRYMQGPIPDVSDQVYDLPGVPWNLYFTSDGAVIHGAYWHDHFGEPWSHGCVNLPTEMAKKLYMWADVGTSVTVIK